MKKRLFAIAFMICSSVLGQTTHEKYANDAKTIDKIIDAYYEIASGSSLDPWAFERDTYIHSKNAAITFLYGKGKAELITLEAFQTELKGSEKKDLYEKELKRKVIQYGNVAQVWSAYEIRNKPEVATNYRGLVSLQLHFEEGRWFIDYWTNEMENDTNALVTDFLREE